MKIIIFICFIPLSAISAPICGVSSAELPNWINQFQQYQSPMKCDSQNQTYPLVESTEIKPQRLSTKCSKSWKAKNSKGKLIKLPAGLRVVRLDQKNESKIFYHMNGEVLEATIDHVAFEGKKGCKEEEQPSFEAFLEESLFSLQLAGELNSESSPSFTKEINLLKEKISELSTKKDNTYFKNLEVKWNKNFNEKDRVQRLDNFQNLVSSNYDPILSDKIKISDGTLPVPISQKWFESVPELKVFYQKEWLNSGKDIRISAGASGEGVTNYQDGVNSNESYLEMSKLLEQTESFLSASSNPLLKNSSEAQWLKRERKKGFASYQRMIFISPDTWERNPMTNNWADYVPVDQSLGGLNSDYLMSVLIHEINVNTSGFLPQDTHMEYESSASVMECIKQQGVSELAKDPYTLQRAFGLNAQISVIYLKMILTDP